MTDRRLWDESRILVNMDAQRRRLFYLRANPKVTLTVLDPDDRFVHVSMQGLIELADDPDLSGIDRLAKRYIGEPYPDRERPRVNGWIEIEHWHEWVLSSKQRPLLSVLLPAVFVVGVADADTSSVEPAGDRRGAVPDSDRIMGVPCVRTHRAGEVGPVVDTRLADGWFPLNRWHVP